MAPGSRTSIEAMPAIRKLADRALARGISVFGLIPDPAASADVVRRMAVENLLTFPILLDPTQGLTRDCEVAATPEAVVLDPEGHVLHRGAIGDGVERALQIAPRRKMARKSARGDRRRPTPGAGAAHRSQSPDDVQPGCGADPLEALRRLPPSGRRRPVPADDVSGRGEAGRFRSRSDRIAPDCRRGSPSRGTAISSTTTDSAAASWPRSPAGQQTGALEGEAADLPAPPTFPEGWRLGTPDVILAIPEPFPIPAEAKDLYRAFRPADPPATRASRSRPSSSDRDNKRVVHHSRIYVDEARDCRKLDAADPAGGFEAFSGGGVIKPGLGAWIPGLVPRFPAEGVGRVLKSGSDLILMIHYHGTGKPEVDQSRIGLYFSKTPPRRWPNNVPLSTDKINIPPGSKRHRVVQTSTIPADVHAYSILPHGHFLIA